MSLYPPTPANPELYPTTGNFVTNPMTSNLSAGGFGITNLNTLGMTGSGAITGVVTINGSAYPPLTPTTKNNVWLYSKSIGQDIFSGYGAQQNAVTWETIVYNSPLTPGKTLNSTPLPSGFWMNSAFVTPYAGTYRVSVVLNGTMNQNGSFSCLICKNFSAVAGGDMVWTRQSNIYNSLYQTLSSTATTTITCLSEEAITVLGGDADATGDSVNVSGTAVTGPNVIRISTFMIEFLG